MATLTPLPGDAVSVRSRTLATDAILPTSSLNRARSGAIAASFWIQPTDWSQPGQSMTVRVQTSADGGNTWRDEVVSVGVPLPDPETGRVAIGFAKSSIVGQDVLVRCVCDVRGAITYAVAGKVD